MNEFRLNELSEERIQEILNEKIHNIELVEEDLKNVKHERSIAMIKSHITYLEGDLERFKRVYN